MECCCSCTGSGSCCIVEVEAGSYCRVLGFGRGCIEDIVVGIVVGIVVSSYMGFAYCTGCDKPVGRGCSCRAGIVEGEADASKKLTFVAVEKEN